MMQRDFDWDVCLSFAGEDREYVEGVASALRERGIRVFYDRYEQVSLWGKDLYEHLDDIYCRTARYCVMFVSEHYAEKLWTSHERKSAQSRAFSENSEYVLPARFDDTAVPGLRDTVGYIDLRQVDPSNLAALIEKKLGGRQTNNFFPPEPDLLFDWLGLEDEGSRQAVLDQSFDFFQRLQRMEDEERLLVYLIFLEGCPADLPENKHINIDLLRRCSSFNQTKIMRILSKIRSLGFYVSIREGDKDDSCHIGGSQIVVLEWHDLSVNNMGNATQVADAMIAVGVDGYCLEHGLEMLSRLDFSQLSSATAIPHEH